jgi:hypothetical protein
LFKNSSRTATPIAEFRNECFTRRVRSLDIHLGRQPQCRNSLKSLQEIRTGSNAHGSISIQEGHPTWINREGRETPLVLADILIIAPYNTQVFELQRRLPEARIGTVDKFQGQEAPLVIYSMTTSSHADAPRGMEFLYSLNRFNVATSRAKCICVLVASPTVFEADCRTPDQMRMANAYCRYLELAQPI